MTSIFLGMSFFFLVGSLIASLVSGDATPLIVTIVALAILRYVFRESGGGG
jgi:hypothetical protein